MAEVDKIINDIKRGITQESYSDRVRYLQDRIREFSDHPDAKDIEKACNRLIGELMPEEKKTSILDKITREINSVHEQLNQARDLIRENQYAEAFKITMPLSELADKRPIVEDDGESSYFNFTEDFERVIYLEIERQNGRNTAVDRLKETPFPYFDIYGLNGTCLIELGQYQESAEEFKKASYWNPASAYARFQYVRVFFEIGAGKDTWALSADNMKYLFRKNDISQCYYYFAHCYIDGGDMEAAIACLFLCNYYYRNEDREYFMKAMMKKTGVLPSYFSGEKMRELSEKYRFPLEPEKTAVKLAYENGAAVMDEDPELAVYYLRIANELSDAQEIKDSLTLAEKRVETINSNK